MANSLVKLTLESNQYERGIKQAHKSWNDFTKGIGLSVSKFTAIGAAIGAVTGALKVAKDAFFKNEQQLDEWGRMVESSKSIYNGFLNSLNNGDISGFLSNINTITEAARAAYDALDNLGTFNAFNQINTQRTRTGLTEAMAGYRMGETSKGDVQKAAKAYQEELRTRQKLEQEAYSQAVRKVAAERGVPWGNLEQALSGSYGDYEKLKGVMPSGKRTVYQAAGQFGGTLSYEVPMAVTAEEKMGEALRKLNDTELKELQALGAQAQRTAEEIAQIDKQMARVLNGRQSGGTIGGGGGRTGSGKTKIELSEMQMLQKQIQELEQEYIKLGSITTETADKRRGEIRAEISENEQRINQIKLLTEQSHGKFLGGNMPDVAQISTKSLTETLMPTIDQIREELKANPIIIPIDTANRDIDAITKTARTTAQVVGSIGQAFSAIEDPAAKVAATVAQAIATVALAYSQAMAKDVPSKMNIFSFIAAATAATVSMATTIASIHSATGYAQGGIVKGNSYSGDNMMFGGDGMYGLNAGEVVLTKAQQGNLASQLQGGGMQTIHVVGKIRGTDIILSADRSLKEQGLELAVWGRG